MLRRGFLHVGSRAASVRGWRLARCQRGFHDITEGGFVWANVSGCRGGVSEEFLHVGLVRQWVRRLSVSLMRPQWGGIFAGQTGSVAMRVRGDRVHADLQRYCIQKAWRAVSKSDLF